MSSSSITSGFTDPTIHITTHNESGKAAVHSSKKNEWSWYGQSNVGFNVVYTTSSFPPSLNDDADIKAHEATMASGKLGLVQKNGTVCRIVDFAPGNTPMMHRTQSLDYGIVLEGELDMELDDGSVTHMKKGDIAVQRATNHAWKNASTTQWARMIFILQDCQPVVVGGERLKEDLRGATEIPASGNDV